MQVNRAVGVVIKRGDGLLEVAMEMLRIGRASAWAEWHIDTETLLNGCPFCKRGRRIECMELVIASVLQD